ncbi:mRNA-decapping enzyme-like protein [Beta vulgaris subsp. vulgaris]|uniref:mRNA-decapping enzyme-like protein n=1 Tax=Beta vulgaris subsp. vulgaris TaxID=3555 RepID=UPI0020368BF2|nr:mRNA-decapping enzyme-like protein [Beta vulgaris subsp. vulgaris]
MAQSGKLMPNLDQNSTKLLNLTVLQRIDPSVEEILITAAHVTFYEFNVELSQWSRKDVEGSLFVVKRNKQPRFQFIVMNRRNTENLVENLLGDFEYEIQVPYLLYRNAAQEVNGIWFYNARECEEVANLFGRILNAYSKVPTKPSISSSKSEFEELEAVPSMAVIDGPLEPSQLTTSSVNDVSEDPAFVNFFSSAMNSGSPSISTSTGELQKPSAAVAVAGRPVNTPPSPHIASTANITSASLLSLLDISESNSNSNRVTDLVKPSSFSSLPSATYPLMAAPVSSSVPTAPPLYPPNIPHPYGAPLLHPFPPPTPPPSLTPTSAVAPNYGTVLSRDKVREALMLLIQDNQFIDMVYRTLLNAHHS